MKVSLPAMYMVQPPGLVFFIYKLMETRGYEEQHNVTKDDVFVFKQMRG